MLKPSTINKIEAAIRANLYGTVSEWLEAADIAASTWYDNKEQCEAIVSKVTKEAFVGLQKKAVKAMETILDDPKRKDFARAAEFVLNHAEWLTPDKHEIMNGSFKITIK